MTTAHTRALVRRAARALMAAAGCGRRRLRTGTRGHVRLLGADEERGAPAATMELPTATTWPGVSAACFLAAAAAPPSLPPCCCCCDEDVDEDGDGCGGDVSLGGILYEPRWPACLPQGRGGGALLSPAEVGAISISVVVGRLACPLHACARG